MWNFHWYVMIRLLTQSVTSWYGQFIHPNPSWFFQGDIFGDFSRHECEPLRALILILLPPKSTWNLKINPLTRRFIFQTFMFGFHVSLQGCTYTFYVHSLDIRPCFMLHIIPSIFTHEHDTIQSVSRTVQTWMFPPRVTVGKMPFAKRKPHKQRSKDLIPIWSMYGIFTYIYHKNQPNVGEYAMHGSYGIMLLGGEGASQLEILEKGWRLPDKTWNIPNPPRTSRQGIFWHQNIIQNNTEYIGH